MDWTQEFPTVDGQYWVRIEGEDDQVVEILNGHAWFQGDDDDYPGRPEILKANGAEFYGPLTPPQK